MVNLKVWRQNGEFECMTSECEFEIHTADLQDPVLNLKYFSLDWHFPLMLQREVVVVRQMHLRHL